MGRHLESEQVELLQALVEAEQRLPRGERQPFLFYEAAGNTHILQHPGLPDGQLSVLRSDIMSLRDVGLIRVNSMRRGSISFDLRPVAYTFCSEVAESASEPVKRVEDEPARYLSAESFRRRYPDAYARWAAAGRLLWAEDAREHLTRVGHDCTEALQAFATALVELHQPPGVESNPAFYTKRLDAVIHLHKARVGERRRELLHALVGYWVAAGHLAERQEHGSYKEGEPVTWDDARRVVFHTALVMFEVDRTLPQP